MSQKTKHEASMSRLPGNRSAKFVPYLIPALIGLFAVVVVPFIWNIYLSFTRWRGVGPVKWVGLKNWKRLFSDSTFWISFANSFWIIVAIVVIPCFPLFSISQHTPQHAGGVPYREKKRGILPCL